MPIRVLSERLAARIAAGEVVERPASVVRELVENSLDAGATRVDVDVDGSGAWLIRVTDNGSGIDPAEIATAFERFATSKIGDVSDLSGIESLGFRGEALPSIASVSEVEAVSRRPGDDAGARHVVRFGEPGRPEPAGAPAGTAITVRNLFGNVPARAKFLASPATELSRISEVVTGLALVRSDVAFSLRANGKEKLATPGDGELRSAVAAVWGTRTAAAMLDIESDADGEFAASGVISDPSVNRATRRNITISVNGRLVQSRRLSFAIEQAYLGYLPERRFPLAVVRVRVPFDDVDVNVHPAKSEVRLLRESLVFAMVQSAVRSALAEKAPVHRVPAVAGRPRDMAAGQAERNLFEAATWPGVTVTAGDPDASAAAVDIAALSALGNGAPAAAGAAGADGEGAISTHRSVLPVLRVIGQSQETYIIAEGPDGLYLIDQHAAHERVLYERVVRQFAEAAAENQPLLEPEPVELSPAQFALVEEHGDDLRGAGFTIDNFGARTVMVRAVPAMLTNSGRSGADALVHLLDGIEDGRHSGWWAERMLATIACHSAVRAGRKMTVEESKALVRQLEQAEQPRTCPHGRPTMIHLESSMLEREFGRR